MTHPSPLVFTSSFFRSFSACLMMYISTVCFPSSDFVSVVFSNDSSLNPYASPFADDPFRKFPTARQYFSSSFIDSSSRTLSSVELKCSSFFFRSKL